MTAQLTFDFEPRQPVERTAVGADDLSDLAAVAPAPDEWERVARLLAEYAADRPRGCGCDRPLLFADEDREARCLRCGHGRRRAE